MNTTLFQYCPKLVVFRNNDSEVLLAQRKGEADYDATYSFIGGKMETSDTDIIEGLRREKNEEVSTGFKIQVHANISWTIRFNKKDGNAMIIPHHYANYVGGDIVLSDEYDNYKWVKITELENFKPKIENIPEAVQQVLRLKLVANSEDMVTL